MILFIVLPIIILLIIASFIGFNIDNEELEAITAVLAWVLIIPTFIIATIGCFSLFSSKIIDDKIAIYIEENIKIETDVKDIVEQYMEHEHGVFKDLKTTSVITLMTIYPELKSDNLVNRQIDIILKNNKEIKKLKTKKLNAKIWKDVLYFGG